MARRHHRSPDRDGDRCSGSGRIVEVGRNAWREAPTTDSGLLIDAADYYRAFYASARQARHYILMSGWQFDSTVPLLRGDDAVGAGEVRFLKFLNALCEQKPTLAVYILAWDFHVVFAAEREWMQRVLFHWMTHPRFQFLTEDCPVAGGSHHQKFVVIDGSHAFLGGMDVCESRWDDRCHRGHQPLRVSRGRAVKPYHDVQVYLAGRDATAVLEDLFRERWACAGGDPLTLPSSPTSRASDSRPASLLSFGPTLVSFSRTQPRADDQTVREVEQLFVDAIAAAQCLIYVETQYFSSRRIYEALAARMRSAARQRLEIVVVVNERAEALKEELAVGLRQADNLQRLRRIAAETDHNLGLYFSLCDGPTDAFRATYIHSKILLVDDRFLTVGSANFTNRSMGTDSELHASWDVRGADAPARRLARAIRRVRVSLLAEHGGLSGSAAIRQLVSIAGLVARLDAFAAVAGARLQRHGPPSPAQAAAMEVVDPKNLPFDPDTSDHSGRDEPADEMGERFGRSLRDRVASLSGSLRRRAGKLLRRRG
jgi:phosphatidylserine/phosphatidylglycerophosphate/cardiolipin synthase-like enzyme